MLTNVFCEIPGKFQLPSFGSWAPFLNLIQGTIYFTPLLHMGSSKTRKCQIPGFYFILLRGSTFGSKLIFQTLAQVKFTPCLTHNHGLQGCPIVSRGPSVPVNVPIAPLSHGLKGAPLTSGGSAPCYTHTPLVIPLAPPSHGCLLGVPLTPEHHPSCHATHTHTHLLIYPLHPHFMDLGGIPLTLGVSHPLYDVLLECPFPGHCPIDPSPSSVPLTTGVPALVAPVQMPLDAPFPPPPLLWALGVPPVTSGIPLLVTWVDHMS